MKKILLLIIFWACIGVLQAQEHFSAASFYPVPNSGREVLDFNPGWRFHRGDITLKADPLQQQVGAGKPTAYRTAGSFRGERFSQLSGAGLVFQAFHCRYSVSR